MGIHGDYSQFYVQLHQHELAEVVLIQVSSEKWTVLTSHGHSNGDQAEVEKTEDEVAKNQACGHGFLSTPSE